MIHYEKKLDGCMTEVHIYDSLEESISDAEETAKNPQSGASYVVRDTVSRNFGGSAADFVGRRFSGLQDVLGSARQPWQEGLDLIGKYRAQLEETLPPPQSVRRSRRYREDDGDDVCMDRMRGGQPYWQSRVRAKRRGPTVIRIVATQSTSAFRNAKDIVWRGAAAIATAALLEKAGYRVELWGAIYNSNTHTSGPCKRMLQATLLKRAGSPLDEATLVNATSGWFFRTIGFLGIATSRNNHGVCSSLGSPTPLRGESVEEFAPGAHVIDNAFSYQDALSQARKIIETLQGGKA